MRKILKKLFNRIKLHSLKSKAIFIGCHYSFLRRSAISLRHGAKKEQIIFDDNINFYGKIILHGDKGKITIGKFSQIGDYSQIQCVNTISLGDYCAIGENVVITDNNSHPTDPYFRIEMRKTPSGHFLRSYIHSENKPIIIGDNVWVGSNSRICKGVTIGDNSIIAANSVVTKDVPSDCIVAGNPAKVVKFEYYEKKK